MQPWILSIAKEGENSALPNPSNRRDKLRNEVGRAEQVFRVAKGTAVRCGHIKATSTDCRALASAFLLVRACPISTCVRAVVFRSFDSGRTGVSMCVHACECDSFLRFFVSALFRSFARSFVTSLLYVHGRDSGILRPTANQRARGPIPTRGRKTFPATVDTKAWKIKVPYWEPSVDPGVWKGAIAPPRFQTPYLNY